MEGKTENEIFVPGAPRDCQACRKPLCMRQQVVNLALGYVDQMMCLGCLEKETECPPADTLERMIPYIKSRDCFAKPWARYADVSFCPDRTGCHPGVCFEGECASGGQTPAAVSGGCSSVSGGEHKLDMRGVACPMNFVKTKLYLDKVATGAVVQVLVDGGEPVESLCSSILAEGHELVSREKSDGTHFSVSIRKV